MTESFYDDDIKIYLKEIGKYEPLSREVEFELSEKIKQGDKEALDKLVSHNLKFVVFIAKQYRTSGVPFGELISEGNIGLMEAAKKFDGSKGNKFITYASWWVRAYITKCIQDYKVGIEYCGNYDFLFEKKVMDEEIDSDLLTENTFEITSDEEDKKHTIKELMSCLDSKESEIIRLYYGINNVSNMTLMEIGKELNISGESVRLIKNKAINKMNNNFYK